jgi:drug/metabolite transporter (DMT)-like permease
MSSDALAVVFALTAAASWGLSAVCVRLGQRFISTSVGTMVSLLFGIVLAVVMVLVLDRHAIGEIGVSTIVIFGLVGIFNFPMGRFFNYLSIRHLGIGRSTPIVASTPLPAFVIAVIFLGETINLATLVGTVLVVAGIYLTLRAASVEA